ncbi:MAG: (2Fe-2S)-binding protein [Pseudomonadota bacterium]
MPSLILNGRPVEFAADPAMPLLWALRDIANLTGTKYGCGTGECGACLVLVDGQALAACTLRLDEAAGRSVTTIEGLARTAAGGRHPVVQALIDEQAIQCGFCTPGLVVAICALLIANPRPGDEEIRAAITNICRCGVYPRLIRAIRRVTGPMAAAAADHALAPDLAGDPPPAYSPDALDAGDDGEAADARNPR